MSSNDFIFFCFFGQMGWMLVYLFNAVVPAFFFLFTPLIYYNIIYIFIHIIYIYTYYIYLSLILIRKDLFTPLRSLSGVSSLGVSKPNCHACSFMTGRKGSRCNCFGCVNRNRYNMFQSRTCSSDHYMTLPTSLLKTRVAKRFRPSRQFWCHHHCRRSSAERAEFQTGKESCFDCCTLVQSRYYFMRTD